MTEQARRFSITHTAGTLGTVAVILGVLWLEIPCGGFLSTVHDFIKLAPLLLVMGITFFLLLAGFGRTFLQFIPDACKTLFMTAETNLKFAEIARAGGQYSIAAGVIGTVFGLVCMLSNLENAEAMGPAIASAFLAILYGAIASEVIFAFFYRVYTEQTTEAAQWSNKGVLWAAGIVILLLCAFFIMMNSMSVMTTNRSQQINADQSYLELKPFETNISDAQTNHVVKFTPCLLVNQGNAVYALSRDLPLIRGQVLNTVRSMTAEQLVSNTACDILKSNICLNVNAIIAHSKLGMVTNVLFSEFLVK